MKVPTIHVLFVSRCNAARSLMAEACLREINKSNFKAFSCGVPGSTANTPDMRAMAALGQAGLTTKSLRCKSWAEFAQNGIHSVDFVITLADNLDPPSWPGQPDTALWSFPDRAIASASFDAVSRQYLQDLYLMLRRLQIFASLPIRGGDRAALRGDVRDLAYLS